MAITTSPSPKTTPSTSAWSRLVELTKNASKTSQANTAEPLGKPECHAPSTTPTVTPVRPIRLRRPIASTSRPDSALQHSLLHAEGMHTSPIQNPVVERRANLDDEADSIEVCPCPVGDPPLPNGRCSLSSRQSERKSKSSGSGPTKTVTSSALWGTRTEQRASAPKVSENNVAVITNVQSTGVETDERRPEDSRNHAEDETGTYALQKASSTPSLGDKTQNLTTYSTNTPFISSPSSHPPRVEPDMSTTGTPSIGSRSAAGPPPSTERAKQLRGHEAPLSCQTFAPLKSDGNTSKLLQQEPAVTETSPRVAKVSLKSKGFEAKEDTTIMTEPEIVHPATPSSSQESPKSPPCSSSSSSSSSSQGDIITNTTPAVELKRKTKRRLTLHSAKYDDGCTSDGQPPPKKKTKLQATKKKQTVQTTLSLAIGGNPGMRECKVCDTVYNPFHPEDVKVHAKRHAGVLKLRTN